MDSGGEFTQKGISARGSDTTGAGYLGNLWMNPEDLNEEGRDIQWRLLKVSDPTAELEEMA